MHGIRKNSGAITTVAVGLGSLPTTGFVRQFQIIGNRRTEPPSHGPIPVSASTWWEWVRTGKAPAPLKLGPATTVWRAEEIRLLIDRLASGDQTGGAANGDNRGTQLVRARHAKRRRSRLHSGAA